MARCLITVYSPTRQEGVVGMNVENRRRVMVRQSLVVCSSLLLIAGCSNSNKEQPTSATEKPSSTTSSATSSTTTSSATSSTTTSSAPSPSNGDPVPTGQKEVFCRDLNKAVNVVESPGSNLTETQGDAMTTALQSASDVAPRDASPELLGTITALLADLQAPGTNLPPQFQTNSDKLAQMTADYCG